MSAPATKTKRKKRRKRRRSTAGSRLMTLLLALAGVVMLLVLLIRLPGLKKEVLEEPAAVTAVPVSATAAPAPTPGLPAVDVTSWELRLVDSDHPLGEDFEPPQLTYIADNESVDSRIAHPLNELINGAKAAGYTVYFCSGYRDYQTQYDIYWEHIDRYQAQGMSYEEADRTTRVAVNYPGCSEHQSGLCADLLESPEQDMEPYIGGSGLMLWLEQHCAEYGFVIRYPEDKTNITGIEYEPWHIRYVGPEAAAWMTERGMCLEEFLAQYSQ